VTTRLGILGGAFDPIHAGHLDAAAAALGALSLEQVLFVPTHVPPHRDAPRASSFHRFAMAALAVQDTPAFVLSDMELRHLGPSYTAVTLRHLHARGLSPSQLFFITGVDAFAEIATWHDYPAVLDASHFVVVSRPGYPLDALPAHLAELQHRFVEVEDPARVDTPATGTSIFFVRAKTTDVSSTDVRRRLASGDVLDDLVPKPVADYAHRHRLYQPAPGAAGQLHDQE
jgi:nicotinate-nucleotide adenylyltransferase